MKTKKPFWNINIKWLMAFLVMSACVERIDFDVPPAEHLTMVEGMISDNPGPYTVKLSTAINLDADSLFRPPVRNAKIKLYDDEGKIEDFVEVSPGEYVTGGLIQGQVGHTYHIRIETSDGVTFESEPERINPGGEVEDIRYEFEARTIEESYGELPADVFNIYVDAYAGQGDENYVRWRFNGTYKVLTFPELHTIYLQGFELKDPLPCSGYIVTPAPGGGKLEQVAECSCCTCWAKHFESEPQLSDVQFVSGNQFRNIKVAEVPINQATFYDKYRVEVEQMSLSRKSYEFFKLVRAQKVGASSIFQPPSGEIIGNVHAINSTEAVVGIFWATSVRSKSIFIARSEVPYLLPPIYFATEDCTRYYANSSTDKPAFWE